MYSGNKKYTNGEITVFWYPKKCIHATTCYTELIEVFNPLKRPWVNMSGASTKEIVRVVKLCPTQALDYKYNHEIADIQQNNNVSPDENTLSEARIIKDGPLILKGDFRVYHTDGEEIRYQKMYSICRCGKSNDLPYCDGTHIKTGYKDK